jgi:DNA-binding transcriptional regulator YhcF (GntR family)
LYDLYNGSNNGELFLSIRDAGKRLGVGKNTAHNAFRALESRGFIRARERGLFTTRRATTWILTEFSFGTKTPTKDFMRWRPEDGYKKQNIVPLRGTRVP